MAAGDPIKLGSATSGWTFQASSHVEESASGIQTCSVIALWPNADTVLSNLPAAGASVSTIESTGFIPSSFVLDYTEAGPVVEYIEGKIARVTFRFKRQDPNHSGPTNSRQVFPDTIINYKSIVPFLSYALATGETQDGIFGFPEPVCTVKYNTSTEPAYSDGIYALPGTARSQGFPSLTQISVPYSISAGPGSVITYYDATTMTYVTTGALTVQTTLYFSMDFRPNASGWQLTKIKYDPVANRTFFDVEESWRNYYFFVGVTFLSAVPPLPSP